MSGEGMFVLVKYSQKNINRMNDECDFNVVFSKDNFDEYCLGQCFIGTLNNRQLLCMMVRKYFNLVG